MATMQLVTILFLVTPLVIGGALHMAVVRWNLLSFLKIPVHAEYFGENKTWRGFVVMPLLTVPGTVLIAMLEPTLRPSLLTSLEGHSSVVLGLLLGLAYVVAELPTSFVKRRLGVLPGELPEHHRVLFVFFDQADSAVACALVYAICIGLPHLTLALLMIVGPLVHLAVNVSLFLAGLRKRPT